MVVVLLLLLPDTFRGMRAWRNSSKSVHAPRSGLEVKNRSSAKDGVPERLKCGTIQKEAS